MLSGAAISTGHVVGIAGAPGWVTGLGVAGTFVGLITGGWAIARAIHRVMTFLDALNDKVDPVHQQVTPNGGDSIRDRVVRLGQQLDDYKRENDQQMKRMNHVLRTLVRAVRDRNVVELDDDEF